ncbi:SgcJ/EcaC family oxidoreductase [Streptomyces sp. 5-10]|uniref:SgcJ/EcaC family oxidoreductase n=1 Tax=Streptomyces sp. 5-10 TaxID=878925 RepID=UPI00168BFA7A|nr:SgcJ/EcaC family oxidoreductase [Streptomyces sp. 5-10]MBD3011173.1 SgcJ/EcaC family oxidoreductase [Streptomyces sp. 5-10]
MKGSRRLGSALVLGGGVAGLLAAAALIEYVDTITVVERDRLPDGPEVRKGVPQGRHLHGLQSSGVQAIDTLLPGTLESFFAAGAHRIAMPTHALFYGPHGWMRQYPGEHFTVGTTRPLAEHIVRRALLAHAHVRILEGAEATGLIGDARRVSGAHIRHRGTGERESVDADLVIDATGRGSKAPQWLAELGLPEVPATMVDAGLAYASRVIRPPDEATGRRFPLIALQGDPRSGGPARVGGMMLVEDGTWMVTLAGTRGAHPPLDEEGFLRYAQTLRHPLMSELISQGTPVSRISGFQNTANHRRHYDRLRTRPTGFLVFGDAATTFNPLYGQGVTAAALSAVTLREELARGPLDEEGYGRTQEAVIRATDIAWAMASNEDLRYPGAKGPAPSARRKVLQRCSDRLRITAACDPVASQALFKALTLTTPPREVFNARTLRALLRGPRHPARYDLPPEHTGLPAPTVCPPRPSTAQAGGSAAPAPTTDETYTDETHRDETHEGRTPMVETETETEKKAVVAVLERLGAAWSELDARALADVFTADATMIAFGYLRKGREEIATRMGEAFQGPYKGSRVVGDVLEVRLLGDSAAVAVVRGAVLTAGETEVTAENAIRSTWALVKQDGEWRVAAYHNSPAKEDMPV